jgi:nitroreductase
VDLFEVIKRRRSVRAFAPEAVEAEKVAQVLAAANAAPSAGNLQGYEIFRVTLEKERAALARAALDQFFVAQAPVVLVFCANQARSAAKYRERGARLYAIQDATIACAFAMLAATALGLGTVWVGAFDDAAVQRVLGCPDLLPVAILPVGYPAEEPEPTPRRSLTDLVHEVVRPDVAAGETGVSWMSGMPR